MPDNKVLYTANDVQALAHLSAVNQLIEQATAMLVKARILSGQMLIFLPNESEKDLGSRVYADLGGARRELDLAKDKAADLSSRVMGRPVQVAELLDLLAPERFAGARISVDTEPPAGT